jgi:hypothetical protein
MQGCSTTHMSNAGSCTHRAHKGGAMPLGAGSCRRERTGIERVGFRKPSACVENLAS